MAGRRSRFEREQLAYAPREDLPHYFTEDAVLVALRLTPVRLKHLAKEFAAELAAPVYCRVPGWKDGVYHPRLVQRLFPEQDVIHLRETLEARAALKWERHRATALFTHRRRRNAQRGAQAMEALTQWRAARGRAPDAPLSPPRRDPPPAPPLAMTPRSIGQRRRWANAPAVRARARAAARRLRMARG